MEQLSDLFQSKGLPPRRMTEAFITWDAPPKPRSNTVIGAQEPKKFPNPKAPTVDKPRLGLPFPPAANLALQAHLSVLKTNIACASQQIEDTITAIQSRRSSRRFQTFDPVLLPLTLLSEELVNVHTCVRQALEYDFLSQAAKATLDTDFANACAELSFAIPHLAMQERNYSLTHRSELAYCAHERDWQMWEDRVLGNEELDSDEQLKQLLKSMFPLGEELQRAVENVEKILRTLTKIRIRYKTLLYEAMSLALERDDMMKKGGIAMDILLHPAWN